MVFFIGLRALLHKKDEDMGRKRGKRKNKYNNLNQDKETEAIELMSKKEKKRHKDKEDNRKPFEKIVLLPPRDAQEGHY